MTVDPNKVYELELDYEHWEAACEGRLRNLQITINEKIYSAEIVRVLDFPLLKVRLLVNQ
jgi:hypothetical protein